MRAYEFVTEEKRAQLPVEFAAPMNYAYELPGLSSSVFYPNYRFGVALARARSESEPDTENPYRPEWTEESAIGPHAIIVGATQGIDGLIDRALQMTGIPGGKQLISKDERMVEPPDTNTVSPLPQFAGYKRR